MKRLLLWNAVALACLVSAFLSSPSVRALGSAEADGVVGGQVISPYDCMYVGTCIEFNNYLVKTCPDVYCLSCEHDDRELHSCTVTASGSCLFQGNQGTDCGLRKIGACTGSVCHSQTLIYDDVHCSDGPDCDPA